MPSFIKDRYVILKRNLKFVITLFAAFIVGAIFGAVFYGKKNTANVIYVNAVDYYVKAVTAKSGVISVALRFFLSAEFLILAFFLFSLSVYALPLAYFTLFIRGTVTGAAGAILIGVYGLNGIIVFILMLGVQSLLLSAASIGLAVSNLNINSNCKNNSTIYFKLESLIMASIACVAIALYGLVVLLIVVRPLYAIF